MYNNYNPYFNQQQRPIQQQFDFQPTTTPYIPQTMPTMAKNNVIQGKSVDSIDVVKATEIPMDGSISYFPLSDGTAIVTKQLQMDGTSKIVVYKPVEESQKEQIVYVTKEELDKAIKNFDMSDITDEIKELKKEIKDIKKELK